MKLAAKGVQGRKDFKYEQYKDALYKDSKIQVENKTFRLRNGVMCTIAIKKVGLSAVFTKGHVLEDKITVRPHSRHIFSAQ